MAWQERAAAQGRPAAADRSAQPAALVRLASRLLVAQAGASAAIGLGYSRRNAPWLLATILVAVAVCGLACVIRSGSHTAWLAAVSLEVCLVAVGLFLFVYDRYLGGTLLAIIALGTLLHPAVARSFGPRAGASRSATFPASPTARVTSCGAAPPASQRAAALTAAPAD